MHTHNVPSTICRIFSLYTLWPLASTKVRRKFLKRLKISLLGASSDTQSRTEWPFVSSRLSMLSICCTHHQATQASQSSFNWPSFPQSIHVGLGKPQNRTFRGKRFLHVKCPSCCPNQQYQSIKEKSSTSFNEGADSMTSNITSRYVQAMKGYI